LSAVAAVAIDVILDRGDIHAGFTRLHCPGSYQLAKFLMTVPRPAVLKR
jgi:hypothetical protein